MPRGDRYHIPDPLWTKGPQRTIKGLNGSAKILKDLADRVVDLEQEADAGAPGGYSLQPIELCVNGFPAIGYYLGIAPVAEEEPD